MIFNLPVKTFRVDPTLYDKEQIISRITDNYALDPNRNVKPEMGTLHHCYVDYGNPKFKDPDYTKLAPVYQTLVEKYLGTMDLDEGTKYTWEFVNYAAYGDTKSTMRSHLHSNCDFSAVHYIQFDEENHTPTIFSNPFAWGELTKHLRPNLNRCLKRTINNSWAEDWYKIPTKEDDMVFFPASLKHEVMAQGESDKLRITIAINISIDTVMS
tara:strand:- start:2901 stop:3536 length:636 start_codon:yes stop_codon:yes gene_type:complete